MRVLVEVWKIDAWDGETIFINLDGNKVWSQLFSWNDPGSYDLCGDDTGIWPEKKMSVEIIIGHTDSELKFEIASTLKGDEVKRISFMKYDRIMGIERLLSLV